LFGFFISLVSVLSNSSKSNLNHPAKSAEPDVEGSEIKGKILDHSGLEITAIVRNKRFVSLYWLSIRFSVFDSNGNKIGEAIDSIIDLDADGTWKFKAQLAILVRFAGKASGARTEILL
jgi:hypothetical protein